MTAAVQTLLAHVQSQRDAAQVALAAAQARRERLLGQGQQLLDYREHCHRCGPTRTGQSVGVDSLRAHQLLLDRIEHALQQHARQRGEAEAEIARRQQQLLALETKAASVSQLLERRQLEHDARIARRDQRLHDEFASQRAARRGAEMHHAHAAPSAVHAAQGVHVHHADPTEAQP
jgi:flagellar FliJ protein